MFSASGSCRHPPLLLFHSPQQGTQRWLPRAVAAFADISGLFESTDLIRTVPNEPPRQVFEALATDWVRDVAGLWESDVTAGHLVDLYDGKRL